MKWNEIFAQLTMLAQLGLSLATPLLICLAVCYLLCTRLGFGLVTGKQKKRERGEKEVSFNKHI